MDFVSQGMMIPTVGAENEAAAAGLMHPALKFYAPLQTDLEPQIGIGPATFTRASAQYVADHEGVLRKLDVDEPGFTGGRRVKNELQYSNDFSQTYWSKFAAGTLTDNGDGTWNWSADGVNRADLYLGSTTRLDIDAGEELILSGYFKDYVGDAGVYIIASYYAGGAWKGQNLLAIDSKLTSDYQWIQLVGQPWNIDPTIDEVSFILRIDNNGTTTTSVDFKDFQLERISGQSNTAASEYIPTTTAAVSKWFNTTNGNTVSNNIVTEAAGTALTGTKGFKTHPFPKNEVTWSRDLTDVSWVKSNMTVAKDATGMDGVVNSASSLTATANGATCIHSLTLTSAERTASATIRRKTGAGTIEFTDNGGATWTDITANVDSNALTVNSYRAAITATQTNPAIGFRLGTSGDAIEVDFCCIAPGKAGYIFIETTGTAVTENDAVGVFDAANAKVNDISGAMTISSKRLHDAQGLFGFAIDSNNGLSMYVSGARIRLRKKIAGANYESSIPVPSNTDEMRITWKISSVDGVVLFVNGTKADILSTNTGDLQGAIIQVNVGKGGDLSWLANVNIKEFQLWHADMPDSFLQTA